MASAEAKRAELARLVKRLRKLGPTQWIVISIVVGIAVGWRFPAELKHL